MYSGLSGDTYDAAAIAYFQNVNIITYEGTINGICYKAYLGCVIPACYWSISLTSDTVNVCDVTVVGDTVNSIMVSTTGANNSTCFSSPGLPLDYSEMPGPLSASEYCRMYPEGPIIGAPVITQSTTAMRTTMTTQTSIVVQTTSTSDVNHIRASTLDPVDTRSASRIVSTLATGSDDGGQIIATTTTSVDSNSTPSSGGLSTAEIVAVI
ncbi:hypothetical protein HK100_006769, partial [Physocladia obscura]